VGLPPVGTPLPAEVLEELLAYPPSYALPLAELLAAVLLLLLSPYTLSDADGMGWA